MGLSAIEKAAILIEALPYIKEFYGKTVVVKYGGHAMLNGDLKRAVMQDLVLMRFVGMNPVLVHGGGPEITQLLQRLGKKSEFVQGQRVTDRETMEVVEMVLGKVNKDLVAQINQLGAKAVGLSGKDGALIRARRKLLRRTDTDGRETTVDLGFVGEVESVNPGILNTMIEHGYLPVVAPIGVGPEGETLNINADYVAGSLAAALRADKLVLLTDVEGVFASADDRSTLLSTVTAGEVQQLIDRGAIAGGMIPKVECCLAALAGGVGRAHIIDGRLPHSILLEIFTREGIGTMVVP
ncbi:MAG: acetylglutamate kinase [Clostridia bacterium]|jgi:acetylglutamate kinase|nr:acetylglutamate kinase [Clostridia bacterium]MDH7572023.1 acetylglutamate kinase [Clostridia bacterium]